MSKLPSEYVDSVLEATDLVALVNQRTPLKQKGAEFVGLCCFHDEKSPSLYVNKGKGSFLCRGCGAKGNAIHFLLESEGLQFRDAVEQLARQAGLPLPDEVLKRDPAQVNKTRMFRDLMASVQLAYKSGLRDSKEAQDYLRGRGITPEMANDFGIGYAPPGRNFLAPLAERFGVDMLVEAGVTMKSAFKEGEYVDQMSDRIIFPIRNSGGHTIAFGGRAMSKDAEAKYLNTPETSFFKKGSEIYGLFESAKEIHRSGTVIVAEGYIDVVIPHGHGVRNVVSAMGVALQPDTIAKLFKTADTIVYCFDGDAAGKKAALRALTLTLPLVDEHKRCRFVFLPSGMDPDEFVRKHGAEEFMTLVQKSEPMSKYMVREFRSRHDLEVPEGKAKFAAEIMDLIETMTSPTLHGLMVNYVQDTLGPDVPLPRARMKAAAIQAAQQIARPAGTASTETTPTTPEPRVFARRDSQEPPRASSEGPNRAASAAAAAQQAIAVAKQAEMPSLAVRVLSCILREPAAADHFEAEWLRASGSIAENEIAGVDAVVGFVRARDQDLISREQITAHFATSDVANLIHRATASDQGRPDGDPIEELNSYVEAMHAQLTRNQKARTLAQPR